MKNLFITGDCHKQFDRFKRIPKDYKPEETAIIILGDAGINWHLDVRDNSDKEFLTKLGYTYYCVKGNHEADPKALMNIMQVFDRDLQNPVLIEPEYPNIRYLIDGMPYYVKDKKMVVLGGAYSVDKEYRLAEGWKWFSDEQLDAKEQAKIYEKIKGQHFDYVFSHTCPYSWRPTDKFLPYIDQSKVDSRTEHWLEDIKNSITFNHWYCGHYHIWRDLESVEPSGFIHFLYKPIVELETNKTIVYY